ncbi:hypothetical protein F7018_15710 [Tenacibaculum aiptasiae]|uniref:RHS repeat protein n=1 Tax=Tenacibaculum aiptasiae TaxID=426481 RepID=A0A7J5A8N1_9FLAO|nr:hypothetical protein [Tenacibaculum aiptasiae]KAB1153931.1 hypothetical protein F7018_15710 [Tenacibaculum aiptasiae]
MNHSKILIFKLLILLVLTGCSSKAKPKVKNDLTKHELSGNVKSADVFFYHVAKRSKGITKTRGGKTDAYLFNNSGNLLESKSFHGNEYKEITDFAKLNNVGNALDVEKDKDFNLRLKCVFSYNEKDKLKEEIRYNPEGVKTTNIVYEYGDKGERTKVIYYDGANGTIRGETNNTYNDKNELISSVSYGQKYTFEYDNNGNKIQTNCITAKKKYTYKYDSDNNVIEEVKYDLNKNNTMLFKTTFSYNSNGLLIKKADTNPSGDNYENNYIYDDNDNLIEHTTTFTWRKPTKYIFENDKNGNWVKKYKYEGNECLYLWERNIEYYN